MFKKFSTYICWKKIHKMGCLKGSGVPVLYTGRAVPKDKPPLAVAARFKESVWGRLLAEITGSNPVEG
jgi:hypothetical protein